jgi:fumarate hydratase, class II
MKFREEKDSMGTVRVPLDAYYGAQTQRAADNFPISGLRMPVDLIRALALIKASAARTNRELGLLSPDISDAIAKAAREVQTGELDRQFVVDLFQTGSGTSTNMNMNEVVASRANEILTGTRGGKSPVHPNDHVNLGQSSNDVIPSAIHVAALTGIETRLIPALEKLHRELSAKVEQFDDVAKIGRTHLQDAVPMTLGQEFSGYARQIELGIDRLASLKPRLAELALGGTAVGTGLNAHPDFAGRTIERVAKASGLSFREAENHFEAQGARDAAVETAGVLKTIAVSLTKVANDIRWLGSGPRCGIGEIRIPSLQPGSSIMPGKVNPVIPEVVLQVAAQVMGNDVAITFAGQAGNFELNVMLPVIAHNLLEAINLTASAAHIFSEKCIRGIQVDRERCQSNIEKSLSLITALVPVIGYDRAAEIAKEAHRSGKTIREIVLAKNIVGEKTFDELI